MWIDRVLRDERRVVAQRLGVQNERPVAFPRRIIRLIRVLERRAAAMNQRPDTEANR